MYHWYMAKPDTTYINMNDAVEDKVFNAKDVYGPALAIIAMLMATSTLTWTQWHNAIKEIETRINKITRDITVVDLLRERKVKYKRLLVLEARAL